MAEILSFPRIRDRGFIWRQARRMTDYKAEAAEKWLAHQLDLQRRVMWRRGIAPSRIDEQLQALEAAVRHEFSQFHATGRAR